MLSSTIQVDAATKCSICGVEHETSKLSGMKAWAYNMAKVLYGGEILDSTTTKVLRFDTSSSEFNPLWLKGEELYQTFAKLGQLLLAVYVMYDLMTKSAGDSLTPEQFFKAIVRLIIGYIIMQNGFDIVTEGTALISSIFDKVTASSGGGNQYPLAAYCPFSKLLFEKNVFDAMVDASGMFIPWLIMLLAGSIVNITCWARVLDIMMRLIFAPIGMSDLMNDGLRSSGWRYFKRLLASVLQGSVIIATIKGYSILMPVIMNMNGIAAWAMPIVMAFVLIAMMFKASAVANDIIG